MNRIQTIIDKEWAEVFKNRVVLMTIIALPVVFTILPLVILISLRSAGDGGDVTDMPGQFLAVCGLMTPSDCLQVYIVNQFLLMYMMMPLAIPIAIAAYSIVGEKTTRSLEPLLATPITTIELLVGKSLAAAIPAIAATWVCFAIFLLLVPITGASRAVQSYLMGSTWLLAILLVGPLMAILAVIFAIIVSSRVSDPRVAEQVSMVLIVPLLAVLFAQVAGVIVVNVQWMLITAAILMVVDAGMVWLGARLFQREAILTRWK